MSGKFIRFDANQVDEKAVKLEFDKKNKTLKASEESLFSLRAKVAELLLEITVLNNPVVDAKRFKLLEMIEDVQIAAMRADNNSKIDAVLADAAKGRKPRGQGASIFAGMDAVLSYNFLK